MIKKLQPLPGSVGQSYLPAEKDQIYGHRGQRDRAADPENSSRLVDEDVEQGVKSYDEAEKGEGAYYPEGYLIPEEVKAQRDSHPANDMHGSGPEASYDDPEQPRRPVGGEKTDIFEGGESHRRHESARDRGFPVRLVDQDIEKQRERLHYLLYDGGDLVRRGVGPDSGRS